MGKLYMAVTADHLELPLYVTDSCKELASRYGISSNNLTSQIANNTSGKNRGTKFVKVIFDDNDEE